jgi:hypothetical protein
VDIMGNEPNIKRVSKEDIRKRCGHCEKTFKENEIVIDYMSSAFQGRSSYRYMHLSCLFDRCKEELEFDVIMQALGGAKK